mgnify:CR=1 FL=1
METKKRGRGRPAADPSEKRTAAISIKTFPRLKAVMERLAKAEGVTLARYVESVLEDRAKVVDHLLTAK